MCQDINFYSASCVIETHMLCFILRYLAESDQHERRTFFDVLLNSLLMLICKKNYYLHICTRGKLHIGHLFLEGINCLVLTLTKHTIFTISFTIVSPRNVIWTSSVDDCPSQSALRLSPRGSPSIQYWLKLSSKLPEVRDNIRDTVGVVKTRNDEMVLNNVGYGYPYNYRELTTF